MPKLLGKPSKVKESRSWWSRNDRSQNRDLECLVPLNGLLHPWHRIPHYMEVKRSELDVLIDTHWLLIVDCWRQEHLCLEEDLSTISSVLYLVNCGCAESNRRILAV